MVSNNINCSDQGYFLKHHTLKITLFLYFLFGNKGWYDRMNGGGATKCWKPDVSNESLFREDCTNFQTPCVRYSYSRYSYLSSPWDNKCPGGYRLKQQTLVKTSNNLGNGNTGHLHPSDNKCPGGYMWLQDVLR